MNRLLDDRSIGRLTPLEFCKTLVESNYSHLGESFGFPPNCHSNALVNSLSIDQDYQYLLSGCADLSIKLWQVHEQVMPLGTIPRRTGHDFGVSCVSWWPYDTGMFVLASFDHSVKVWDTNELQIVHEFDLLSRVYAFDMQECLIAVASDQSLVRLVDLRTTSNAQTLKGHKLKTLCVKWHPKSPKLLASGGYDSEIRIWDIRRSDSCLCRLDMFHTNVSNVTDYLLDSVKAHAAPVNGLVWDPLGHQLFSAGNDDKLRVWDMINSQWPPINKLINFGPLTRNKFVQTIPLTLNYNYETETQLLIFPSDNGDLYIYRTIDGKLVNRLPRKGNGRTCSVAMDKPFLNRFFCGTIDGEIITFEPTATLDITEVFDV